MSKNKYSKTEKEIARVLKYQSKKLEDISFPSTYEIDRSIQQSEDILRTLGIPLPESVPERPAPIQKGVMVVPSWERLCAEAEASVGTEVELESLFSERELDANRRAIRQLNADYNQIHRLDKTDIAICAAAGLLGAVVDILLTGIPQKTPEGLRGGPLANCVRDWFDKRFPEEEMKKLANSKVSKVPFDAQDNRNTTVTVEGLSAYYHRLLSLGHDPFLGFIFGVADILTGRMTTIDKSGRIVSQVMENYADRKESDIFAAIAKLILHMQVI